MNTRSIRLLICLMIGLSLACAACGKPSTPVPASTAGLHLAGPYLGAKPPGMKAELFTPELFKTRLVNTLRFSPDGTEIVWTETNSAHTATTVYSMKQKGGVWSEPTAIPIPICNWFASFSPDGKLFFLNRDTNIYYAARNGDGWGTPVALPESINKLWNHYGPSVASNGDLYWSGALNDGAQRDIYRAELVLGKYANVSVIGAGSISTKEFSEIDVHIAPDGSYLIFSRWMPPAIKVFVSFRKADGSWGDPVAFGDEVNSGDTLNCDAYVSPDGQYLFFIRARDSRDLRNTYWDPYWVDARVIEALRPR